MVAARGELGGPVQPADLPVDRAQHGQRVEPLDAGVVRDLVVAQQVDVHAGPAGQHVLEHRGDHDVPGDHRGRRAQERVEAAAVHPGHHAGPALPGGRGDLPDHVDQVADAGAQRVGRVGEVGDVAGGEAVPGPAAAPLRAGQQRQRAHGQADVRGVPGEQVAVPGAVHGEQPAPVGVGALQVGGVLRVAADHHVVAVLLVEAVAEDAGVVAVQDAADAGAGLRAPVGVPVGEPVAAGGQPGGEGGHVAVPHRAPGDVVAQAVDLQEQHPGRPVVVIVAAAAGAPGGPAEEQLVLVEADQAAGHRAHRGEPGHHGDRGAEVGDRHPGHREGEQQHPGAEQQEAADAQGEQGDRGGHPQDQRPQHRGQHAEQQRDHRRLPPLRHVEPDQPAVQQHQRGRRQRPHREQPGDDAPAPDQPPRARRGHLRAHVRLPVRCR